RAEASAKGIPSGDCARNVDCLDTDRIDLLHAVRFEIVDGKPLRRPSAGIQAVELSGFCFVNDGEQISADAVNVRLNDTHNCVGGDGGINGISTLFQNVSSSL